jgi:hypothetical protein
MGKIQTIPEFLSTHGPSLSSDIAAAFRASGLSDAAARQRLSRLPEGVMVLGGLSFPKRARFLYNERQFGTERYWTALLAAIKESNPAYAAALAAVRSNGGLVRRSDFDVICGSPVRQKKQVSSETVLQRLCAVSLLDKINDSVHGEVVFLKNLSDASTRRSTLRARLMTEDVLLDAIRLWAGRMNISSPNKTEIRGEIEPKYSTFRFHLCGPSYLRPIRQHTDSQLKPGFFVPDVMLGTRLDEDGVSAFIRKCSMLSNIRSARPFLPMLISDGFTPEALKACRSHGIMATTPATLFGEDVARALSDLMDTLTNAAAVAAASPDKLEKLFQKLSSIEGSAGNLRGALFELLVGHMVRQIEGGSIDIGSIVPCDDGKDREIDVRHVKERELSIYECKGYQPDSQVNETEIEAWLRKISFLYSSHRGQERFVNSNITFEFWTCGTFDADALALLEKTQQSLRKYSIAWKDGKAVRKYASKIDAPGIRKILEEHYFNHPINFIKKAVPTSA